MEGGSMIAFTQEKTIDLYNTSGTPEQQTQRIQLAFGELLRQYTNNNSIYILAKFMAQQQINNLPTTPQFLASLQKNKKAILKKSIITADDFDTVLLAFQTASDQLDTGSGEETDEEAFGPPPGVSTSSPSGNTVVFNQRAQDKSTVMAALIAKLRVGDEASQPSNTNKLSSEDVDRLILAINTSIVHVPLPRPAWRWCVGEDVSRRRRWRSPRRTPPPQPELKPDQGPDPLQSVGGGPRGYPPPLTMPAPGPPGWTCRPPGSGWP
jgi:hypothetical protein